MSHVPGRAGMRTADLLGLAFAAFPRQKVRSALTVLGVVIGVFALVASLAVGRGVDRAIVGLFRGTDALRQVGIFISYEAATDDAPEAEKAVAGSMSDAKRERLRRALARAWGNRNVRPPRAKLDAAGLGRLARIPRVVRVVPIVNQGGTAAIDGLGAPRECDFGSADAEGQYRERLLAGRAFSGDRAREAIVQEAFLYRLGLVGDDVDAVLGRTVRVEYRARGGDDLPLTQLLSFGPRALKPAEAQALVRALGRLAALSRFLPIPSDERAAFARLLERTPAASPDMAEQVYAEVFTVVGVARESSDEEDKRGSMLLFGGRAGHSAILLPPLAAADLCLKSPLLAQEGLYYALVVADRDEDVRGVSDAVRALGYSPTSMVLVIETIRLNVLMITLATAFIAAVALAVAAIGITNTMIMGVLERTHEIGIMKALGARTGQVRAIFLVEGASIGLLGGVLGVLLAWLVSIPGDRLARSIMQAQSPRPVEGSLFAFPAWLVLGAPALAALLATLAAAYPAHRAATVDPITSLRHE